MCAIFGFVSEGGVANMTTLRDIVEGNIGRGPHAFGFSWIDTKGRMRAYRQAGNLALRPGFITLMEDAVILIGHLRYFTHGDPSHNINNHPHPCDGGWVVHNGVISNYEEILKDDHVWPVSECDSETLGLLIENADDAHIVDRVSTALDQVQSGTLAMMGLWKHPRQMVVARRGNPLHISIGKEGVYMGSLSRGLPGNPKTMQDDAIVHFTMRKKSPDVKVYKI